MGFTVQKAGMCTTVQDKGRFGYMDSGFSPSGVMDKRAYRLANMLVENGANDPVLEFVLAGPTLRFTTDTIIAITGGDFSPVINGKHVGMYKAIRIRRGDILQLDAARSGMFGYLAVAGGGVLVPEVMGSRSTNLKCEIGGYQGRALENGDYVPFVTHTVDYLANLASHTIDSDVEFPKKDGKIELRVIMGPQDQMFTTKGIETFLGEDFETTAHSDRMGYRLAGPKVETVSGSDIISDGIVFGAIQIPSDGKPIIMLSDRQTTGGYAKIATIASVDIPKLVQARPGTKVTFTPISIYEAQDLVRAEAKEFSKLAKHIKRPARGDVSPRRTARRLTPFLIKQSVRADTERKWIRTKE
ncbi:MAG: biotin-dependent carboxyltransferase family protein [bacterium]|nr:biotin-dependent carboxyltransferase family protein [bacterium]